MGGGEGVILQYFWPALSDNWSWKPIFRLFEGGHFTQVLLYSQVKTHVQTVCEPYELNIDFYSFDSGFKQLYTKVLYARIPKFGQVEVFES